MAPSARVLSKTALSTGFLALSRYELEVGKHEGGSVVITREVMERGNAVAVLGYDPRLDVIVLVDEFRPGCLIAGDEPFTDNLCAGGIAEGESAIEAAVRELREETGLELSSPLLAHPGAYVSSGGTSEKIAIVVGLVDSTQAGGFHGNAEESEDIRTVVLSADVFLARVRSGAITDLKTIVAGYWLAEHRAELVQP